MVIAMLISLFLAAAAYIWGATAAVMFLRGERENHLCLARRGAILGAAFLLLAFIIRWVAWSALPMTSMQDGLSVFLLLSTLVMFIACRNTTKPLSSFYLPPLALLSIINAVAACMQSGSPPRELHGVLLVSHVTLAFLAYAFFFGASIASAAYIFQARHLKSHHTVGLFQALPPLERLDHALFLLIRHGYIVMALTVILGGVWARIDHELLSSRWWISPKILRAIPALIFYACTFHMRQLGFLRGQRLAKTVLIGFSVFLLLYLVMGLSGISCQSFWGTAQ